MLSYILVHSQLSSQHRRDINLMVNKVNIDGSSLLHMPTSSERNKHIIIIKIIFNKSNKYLFWPGGGKCPLYLLSDGSRVSRHWYGGWVAVF